MNARIALGLGIVLSASAVAALVSACGGSETTNLDGGDDATMQSDTATGSDSATGNDGGTTTDAGGGVDGSCTGTGQQCRACCANLYPNAAATIRSAERDCACVNPGLCNTPQRCANNLCLDGGGGPNGQCNACLGNADAGNCAVQAITACANDNACAPFLGCVGGCGTGGPSDAGGGG